MSRKVSLRQSQVTYNALSPTVLLDSFFVISTYTWNMLCCRGSSRLKMANFDGAPEAQIAHKQ